MESGFFVADQGVAAVGREGVENCILYHGGCARFHTVYQLALMGLSMPIV